MRNEIQPFSLFTETVSRLINDDGVLLVSGRDPNPMTIAWATTGIIWKTPILTVYVRSSRHSYKCMNELPYFSVNIPGTDLKKQVSLCGSKSGRDTNKIKESGFIMEEGIKIPVPYIQQSLYHYECETIYQSEIKNELLHKDIFKNYYQEGDFHTVYYGKILGVYQQSEC